MRIRDLAGRAGRFAFWRGYARWAHPMADRLAARREVARMVRWPLPWMAPYRAPELHILRNFGLGDVLMCTPALREAKRLNPDCRISLYTDFPDVVEGLPFIERVRPSSERPGGAIWMNYARSPRPRRHLARIMGDQLGVAVRDVRPSCTVREDLIERFRRDWEVRPRPLVLVTRRASSWTPNKDWPGESWEDLVARLAARATVIEVGGPPDGPAAAPVGNYVDLRGRTSLPELIAAVAAADIHVAPVTGTVHIAAAMGVPSVVIYGGYEHPDCSGYPGNIDLYSPVECAPCWLRTPCPHAKKCLHRITPDQVESAVDRLWADARRRSPAADLCDAPAP